MPHTRFYASGRFLDPLRGSKSSGLGGKGWELCDLVRLNYVIVSFEFAATAPVWGQLDLISNLLCCIYWNCYVMPAVFVTAPIKFVTFRLHLQLWVEYRDFLSSFLFFPVPALFLTNTCIILIKFETCFLHAAWLPVVQQAALFIYWLSCVEALSMLMAALDL